MWRCEFAYAAVCRSRAGDDLPPAWTARQSQKRFLTPFLRSFPVQEDDHFLTVCRYVERNALRAGLVRRAEAWPWGSLWQRQERSAAGRPVRSAWPVAMPRGWPGLVNKPQTAAEEDSLRHCAVANHVEMRVCLRGGLPISGWRRPSARVDGPPKPKKVPDTFSS